MAPQAGFSPDGWEHGAVLSARTSGIACAAALVAAAVASASAVGEARREVAKGAPDGERRVIGESAMVDTGPGAATIERRYAREVGLPARDYGTVGGSTTSWQNDRFRDATAFVVELPAGRLSDAAVARHVRAIEAL